MPGSTDHYGFTTLESGESFAHDGYKYTGADRRLMDQLLYVAGEGHHHTGQAASGETPVSPPTLTLNTSGGAILGGTRVAYKISYVNEQGEESVASPEAFVDTPAQIITPGAPSLATFATGGVLNPGAYYYVLSAYTVANTVETRAENTVYITVPATTATNRNVLTLPSLPAGATGFSIYRRAPGQTRYFFLDSVNMSVATPPTTYTDNGSVNEDCDRTLPTTNSTNSTNSITIAVPGATPFLAQGYTWRVYRTYTLGNYSGQSLLQHVVERVSETSLLVINNITDVGAGLFLGAPLDTANFTSMPEPVLLTDSAEVQGTLPMGMVSGFVVVHTFEYPGAVTTSTGVLRRHLPFSNGATPTNQARVVAVMLGTSAAPAGQPLIVDVNKNGTTIFTNQANRPQIAVGQTVSSLATSIGNGLLKFGDYLTVDVDQAGGGATPTDRNLVVTVVLHVSTGSATTSETYT